MEQQATHTDWIARWATYSPKRIAVHSLDEGLAFSYAELHQAINQRVRLLREAYGIAKGDRVAILAMNRMEHLILFFALQRLSAILLPLNYRLAAPEIAYQLQDSGASLLLLEEGFQEKLAEGVADIPILSLDGPQGFIAGAEQQSTEGLNLSDPAEEQVCMVLYTSGTTGKPKGAMITNKMLFWNSINTSLRLNLTQHEVILTFAPFFHTGGWNVLTTPVLHRGGTVILLKKFEPDRTLELCKEKEVSILFGVPTMMQMMADSTLFAASALKSVRYAIVGGEPMPKTAIERWHQQNVPIRQGYGLTEFGPNVFSLNEEDAIRKIGSVGFANFYIETRVVNDYGQSCKANEIGELWLKGPACTPGYWNNEEATSQAIEDGWFKTGDLVRFDEEGYFYIVDRKKDLFISGAENVYPAEIEGVLRKHPNIKEAAVIGVPDERWGEVGHAFIVSHQHKTLDEDQIKAYCLKNLAKYKVPKHISLLDALPKSDSGKILKRALKDSSFNKFTNK